MRILVVEDEELTALVLAAHLIASGAIVLGPVPSVAEALASTASETPIDVAYLDLNLRGEPSTAVADALAARRIPFVVVSADIDAAPPWVHHQRRLSKPASLEAISQALAVEAGRE